MDVDIVNLISNVGFPIAAFLLMWRTHTKSMDENKKAIEEMKLTLEGLKSYLKDLAEAVREKNT